VPRISLAASRSRAGMTPGSAGEIGWRRSSSSFRMIRATSSGAPLDTPPPSTAMP